jgi:acyl-CoA reductase-like NAD-dependent aldehyde dehydrogenase
MSALSKTSIAGNFSKLLIENRPFINGSYCLPSQGGQIAKTCPANGQEIRALHVCSEPDVDMAVQHALRAYRAKVWRNQPTKEKKVILFRLADLMEAEISTLAYLDTLETGRPYANFINDSIPKAISALRWFAEAVDKHPERMHNPSANELSLISHEPLGVVGIITPWNDPLVVAMWKIAPALLMGNSVVIKPAEQSSFSIIRIALLAKQAGIPDGVLNVLPGLGPIVGRAMAMHMDIRGIFFTGSSTIGKEIVRCAGESNMKKVGLECGGKSAFIVSDRCNDLQEAARTLAKSMFYNQGQICSAPSRAILHQNIQPEFMRLLLAELPPFQPGDPFDPDTRVGAISSQEQYARVRGYIDRGIGEQLNKVTADLSSPPCPGGFYIAPTVFADVPRESALAREEIFGPVLVTHTVSNIDEAIAIANDSPYGLAASIWSNNLDEALLSARELEAGIVHVNCYGDDDNSVPFGGVKESGLGRDKSMFAFDDYTSVKTTWIKLTPMQQRGRV